MDTDLFQILTLFLLLGLLLTLFGVFLSLGAIRKLLERSPQAAAASPASEAAEPVAATLPPSVVAEPETDDSSESPLTWARPDDDAGTAEAQRSGWPAPQEAAPAPEPMVEEAQPAPEPEPARSEPASSEPATLEPATSESAAAASAPPARDTGARVLYGDTGLTSATPSEAALRTSEPAEAAPAAQSQPVEAEPQTAAVSEDPQEQPFERDGRWWFRRGDELLVYEEQTGQWVAAPQPSSSGSVAAGSPGAGAGTPAGGAAGGATEGQVTTQHEAVGSFWKCPSCGAVNGSTATSCRMCFTARP